MPEKPSVLIIGLQPDLIDFSLPDYAAFPGLTAGKIQAGLDGAKAQLEADGFDAELCLVDMGQTAETVIFKRLDSKGYDCVCIGAGVRTAPSNFLLFEKIINAVHEHAPRAKICFNTHPSDSVEAVRRWLQPA